MVDMAGWTARGSWIAPRGTPGRRADRRRIRYLETEEAAVALAEKAVEQAVPEEVRAVEETVGPPE